MPGTLDEVTDWLVKNRTISVDMDFGNFCIDLEIGDSAPGCKYVAHTPMGEKELMYLFYGLSQGTPAGREVLQETAARSTPQA